MLKVRLRPPRPRPTLVRSTLDEHSLRLVPRLSQRRCFRSVRARKGLDGPGPDPFPPRRTFRTKRQSRRWSGRAIRRVCCAAFPTASPTQTFSPQSATAFADFWNASSTTRASMIPPLSRSSPRSIRSSLRPRPSSLPPTPTPLGCNFSNRLSIARPSPTGSSTSAWSSSGAITSISRSSRSAT